MIKTDIIKKIGAYRNLPMSEDYDLLLRLVSWNYKIDNIPELALYYRTWRGNAVKLNGLRDIKSANYCKKLYKERLKKGKDSFNIENYKKYIKTSKFSEWFYKTSQKFRNKAVKIRENDGNQFIVNFHFLIAHILSPYTFREAIIFFYLKFIQTKIMYD